MKLALAMIILIGDKLSFRLQYQMYINTRFFGFVFLGIILLNYEYFLQIRIGQQCLRYILL